MEEELKKIRERFEYLEERSRILIEEFYKHLKVRNYAEKTIKIEMLNINLFLSGVGLKDIIEAQRSDVERYLQISHEKGNAPATIKSGLISIRHLYSYLQEEGEVRKNPVDLKRHYVRLDNKLPKPMREEEIERLFGVIRSKRERAIYMLMLRCGLRVSEVSKLKVEEIDLKRHTIRINRGKGGIDRVVYSSEDVESSIKEWMEEREKSSEYLFPSPKKNKGERGLCVGRIQQMMKEYLKEAGLGGKGYSPHNLRHSYATQLLNAGVGIRSIQELMGHRQITETMRYLKLYDSTKREEYFEAMRKIQERNKII